MLQKPSNGFYNQSISLGSPPLGFPPLIREDSLIRGGENHDPAEGRKKIGDFVSKSFGQRCENALKTCFLQEKIVFSKRKTSKFSRLRRGYTPSSPKNFRACGAATTQAIIQIIIIQMTFFEK